MPQFVNRLAGQLLRPGAEQAMMSAQFSNPAAPVEQRQLGNVIQSLLGRGSITAGDETGTVSFDPRQGSFSLERGGFNVRGGMSNPPIPFAPPVFGKNPWVQVNLRTGQGGRTVPDSELGLPPDVYGAQERNQQFEDAGSYANWSPVDSQGLRQEVDNLIKRYRGTAVE